MQHITLVAALDKNGVIGRDGRLPWRLPNDLRHFRRVTLGKPVIMGRKTHVSIGRPLPKRHNIVLTRNPHYAAAGCTVVHSLPEALEAAGGAPEIMVIGGQTIYAQFLPHATRLYLTHVEAKVAGDTHFPDFDRSKWREVARETHAADEKNPYRHHIVRYERKR